MTITELIEKHVAKAGYVGFAAPETPALDGLHLRKFAIDLLRSIEPDREQCVLAVGDADKALSANYWKALEELEKPL